MNQHCPIWGADYTATVSLISGNRIQVEGSERTTVSYFVVRDGADLELSRLNTGKRAQLTTWLIDHYSNDDEFPTITRATIDGIKSREPLPIAGRADRLLRYMAAQSHIVGSDFSLNSITPGVLAWSESIEEREVGFLIHDLMKKGYVDANEMQVGRQYGTFTVPKNVRVTVDGHEHIRRQKLNEGASQAFVAMWLDDKLKGAYDGGIAPAISDAGYRPFLITHKEHINKIEDEVIAEIRRSRFIVADFSHGEDGARGSVYYEAGFAHGLGLDVIFTCQADSFNDTHFDTSHFNHIVWTNESELRERLTARIRAAIGQGPLRQIES